MLSRTFQYKLKLMLTLLHLKCDIMRERLYTHTSAFFTSSLSYNMPFIFISLCHILLACFDFCVKMCLFNTERCNGGKGNWWRGDTACDVVAHQHATSEQSLHSRAANRKEESERENTINGYKRRALEEIERRVKHKCTYKIFIQLNMLIFFNALIDVLS